MCRILGYSLAAAVLLTGGCGQQEGTRGASIEMAPAESDARVAGLAGSATEQRAHLLQRIRAADPGHDTIERALLNEQNELGLVLSRHTNLDDVPKLMRVMLAEMDKAFPGQNHTVVAYTPTNPPRLIGTARLNARTRDMTYTPAQPGF